ncbi:hypothetical protein MBANPS3_012651, partial [Mucor bainieri]
GLDDRVERKLRIKIGEGTMDGIDDIGGDERRVLENLAVMSTPDGLLNASEYLGHGWVRKRNIGGSDKVEAEVEKGKVFLVGTEKLGFFNHDPPKFGV